MKISSKSKPLSKEMAKNQRNDFKLRRPIILTREKNSLLEEDEEYFATFLGEDSRGACKGETHKMPNDIAHIAYLKAKKQKDEDFEKILLRNALAELEEVKNEIRRGVLEFQTNLIRMSVDQIESLDREICQISFPYEKREKNECYSSTHSFCIAARETYAASLEEKQHKNEVSPKYQDLEARPFVIRTRHSNVFDLSISLISLSLAQSYPFHRANQCFENIKFDLSKCEMPSSAGSATITCCDKRLWQIEEFEQGTDLSCHRCFSSAIGRILLPNGEELRISGSLDGKIAPWPFHEDEPLDPSQWCDRIMVMSREPNSSFPDFFPITCETCEDGAIPPPFYCEETLAEDLTKVRDPANDASPTRAPTEAPSEAPTQEPTRLPSEVPTEVPSTQKPTANPSGNPTGQPTASPSSSPSRQPTGSPSQAPSESPTRQPSGSPSRAPSREPTLSPSKDPTMNPTPGPSNVPTDVGLNTSNPSRPPSLGEEAPPSPQAPTETPRGEDGPITVAPSEAIELTRVPRRIPTWTPTMRPTGFLIQNSTEPTMVFRIEPTQLPSRAAIAPSTPYALNFSVSSSITNDPSFEGARIIVGSIIGLASLILIAALFGWMLRAYRKWKFRDKMNPQVDSELEDL